jgi:hypothetical protein
MRRSPVMGSGVSLVSLVVCHAREDGQGRGQGPLEDRVRIRAATPADKLPIFRNR